MPGNSVGFDNADDLGNAALIAGNQIFESPENTDQTEDESLPAQDALYRASLCFMQQLLVADGTKSAKETKEILNNWM